MKTAHRPEPRFEPAEADIQKCAYFLWQEEGCPEGRDLELWLAAKELVRHRVHAAPPERPPGGSGRSAPHRRVTS
ncbi:MAG: DUF2934 domain-containing protein [Verrucomicrobia bacterium]|nr:DUF2934 domain-containing protein [Verrucomicrobiota bacterium]